jgi:hypothetical protein
VNTLYNFSLFFILSSAILSFSMEPHNTNSVLASQAGSAFSLYRSHLKRHYTESNKEAAAFHREQATSKKKSPSGTRIHQLPPLSSLQLPRPLIHVARPPVVLSDVYEPIPSCPSDSVPKSSVVEHDKKDHQHGQLSQTRKKAKGAAFRQLKADNRFGKPKYPNTCVFSQYDPNAATIFK